MKQHTLANLFFIIGGIFWLMIFWNLDNGFKICVILWAVGLFVGVIGLFLYEEKPKIKFEREIIDKEED